MTQTERLERIKKENDFKKSEHARIEGQLQTLKSQLKETYSCDTIEEAINLKNSLSSEIEKLGNSIESSLVELEAKLGI